MLKTSRQKCLWNVWIHTCMLGKWNILAISELLSLASVSKWVLTNAGNAHPFTWKWDFIHMQIELIFIWMVVYQAFLHREAYGKSEMDCYEGWLRAYRLAYSGIRIYPGIYSGYSAPGSRIAEMEIQVFRNENSSQTNAFSHYSILLILIPNWSQTNAPLIYNLFQLQW